MQREATEKHWGMREMYKESVRSRKEDARSLEKGLAGDTVRMKASPAHRTQSWRE